ncbi:hypothetical protein E5D57_011500 [Metarhizium anisopliae]|nr:hypothetical protein E5D57_011500 [Metarhizium anisopliae]
MAHAHINHSNIHFKWSKNIPPVLAVESGAELNFDLKDGFNNLIHPGTTAAQLRDLDTSQTDPAFGPVAVEGAEPGDHITTGSSLYLPVQVAGALFSCGDGHAAQGDGEICGTAIETPMKARLRLTLEKDKPWVKSPHYLTSPEAKTRANSNRGQEYAAVGIDANLLEATKKGVRGAIDWLCAEKDLSREEAYMLCSVVGDLKIVEAVDMPHYAVACCIPLGIFVSEK